MSCSESSARKEMCFNRKLFITIIPRTRMGSELIAHEAEG